MIVSRSKKDIETKPRFNSTNWNIMSEEEKVAMFKDLNKVSETGGTGNNKIRQSYMAQPNVKAFNKVFVSKALTGRPYKWNSVEQLDSELTEFIELCNKTATVPTVTAVCGWLHCSRDIFYAHANNSNSPFSDSCKSFLAICHTSLENGAVDGKVSPAVYSLMGKNYFGLRDDKQITVTPSTSSTVNNSDTMEAIQKQLEEETVPNADFEEK